MTGRRVIYVAGAGVLACAALIAVFVTGNIAQMPAGGAPGGDMGMSGMPGGGGMEMGMGMGGMGMGAGGGGGAIQYEEIEAPEHLLMTYDEYLVETGESRMPLPEAYRLDDEGDPARATENQWRQLVRIYGEDVTVDVVRGKPGGGMADKARAEQQHIELEHAAIRELYEYAVNNCFSAKISHPVLEAVARGSDSVNVRLHVVVQSTKNFPTRAAKRLQPLSRPGMPWRDSATPGERSGSVAGRARLDLVTREGGYTKPVKLYLDAEAIGLWQELWSGTEVRVSLLDTAGKVMDEQTLSAGLDGGICEQMVFPQYCWPHRTVHRMPDISPWGTKLKLFNGATKDMYKLKGWLIGGTEGLRFNQPIGILATLDGAQVELVPSEGLSEVLLKKIGD